MIATSIYVTATLLKFKCRQRNVVFRHYVGGTTMSKREIILQEALKVFQKNTYHQTTINDIATAANVKRTTVYDYFLNKEKIVFALFENMFISNPILSTTGTTLNRLNQLGFQMLKRTSDNIVLYRLLFESQPTLSIETTQSLKVWQKPFIEQLNSIFDESNLSFEDANDGKYLFYSLISTRMSDYILQNKVIELTKDIEQIIRIIRRSI